MSSEMQPIDWSSIKPGLYWCEQTNPKGKKIVCLLLIRGRVPCLSWKKIYAFGHFPDAHYAILLSDLESGRVRLGPKVEALSEEVFGRSPDLIQSTPKQPSVAPTE